MSLKHPVVKSFPYAVNGLKIALESEPNFRVHILLAFLAIILAVVLKFTPLEYAVLVLTAGLVIILELINTMLESIVDLVSPDIQKQAKIAKDVSAGAVLVSSIVAVLIGIILFLPKIIEIILLIPR